MKGITGNPALDAYQRAAVRPVSSTTDTHGATGTGAHTKLTTQAAKLSISEEARALAEGGSHVNAQKVESLRSAIQNGSFMVDSRLVAEKMLGQAG